MSAFVAQTQLIIKKALFWFKPSHQTILVGMKNNVLYVNGVGYYFYNKIHI